MVDSLNTRDFKPMEEKLPGIRSPEERRRVEIITERLGVFLKILRKIGELNAAIVRTQVEIMNMQSRGATQEELNEAWKKLDDFERSLRNARKAFQLFASEESIYGKDPEFRNAVNMVHRALFLELKKRRLEDKLSFYRERLNEVRASILSQKGDTEYLLTEFEKFAKEVGVCENELKLIDEELKELLHSYVNLDKYTGLVIEINKVANELYPYCKWGLEGIFLPEELIDYKE